MLDRSYLEAHPEILDMLRELNASDDLIDTTVLLAEAAYRDGIYDGMKYLRDVLAAKH